MCCIVRDGAFIPATSERRRQYSARPAAKYAAARTKEYRYPGVNWMSSVLLPENSPKKTDIGTAAML